MLNDVRYALRSFLKAPGFTIAAVVALALGIGANTAIFSVVNGVLLKSLPYRDPDGLVIVWERNLPRDRTTNVASPANFLAWRDENHVFESMAAISPTFGTNLTRAGDPVEVRTQLVNAEFFPILGVNPELGRTFTPQEDDARDHVVVISHRLWQQRLGGRPVTDTPITINGVAQTVVGVMPPGFHFLDRTVDVWVPIGFTAENRIPRGRSLTPVARLKPGVTVRQAQSEMDAISARLTARYPDFDTGWVTSVVPLAAQITGDVRPALYVLLGAVGFVLLIACANVANLLLSRATSREREMAVRSALGADRRRIVGQLLIESLLLSAAGALAGLALAWAGVKALTAVSDQVTFPRLDAVGIDPLVLVFTAGLAVLSGLIFGLAPALSSASPDLTSALKEGGRGGSSGRSGRARNVFVVVEIALALVLLVGAGLLARSFARLLAADPGFDPQHALTLEVTLPRAKYAGPETRTAFFEELVERARSLPGVTTAGAISFLPITGAGAATGFDVVGQPAPARGQEPVCDVRIITGDYFGAMRIPLVAGRLFTTREEREPNASALINETLARKYFPNQNPIGQHLKVSWNGDGPDEIVGVVGDVKMTSLEDEIRPAVYYPYSRTPYPSQTLILRTAGDPLGAAAGALQLVKTIDPELPVSRLQTMEQVIAASVAQRRILMLLLGVFAAIALVLAALGIYGVMAYMVSQRAREIGIRMALGSPRAVVMRMVVGQAMLLTGAGVAAGLAGAWLLTRLMEQLLFGVAPSDPLTFGAVALGLSAIAALAAAVPGMRATSIDPIVALRSE